ncbi:MAG: hypothetical protein IKS52_01290, partial [Clostridia bacterium]|nr:hypothetical protein [Clostridia bacterium]
RAARVVAASADEITIDLSAAYAIEGVEVVRTWRLLPDGVELRDSVTGAQSVVERIVTRVEPTVEPDGTVRIAGCILSGPAKPSISTRTFVPRLVSNIGMKPLETLYLIDYAPSGGESAFSLTW